MPLSGARVVDLTRILAGPFCSMLLAERIARGVEGIAGLTLIGLGVRVATEER